MSLSLRVRLVDLLRRKVGTLSIAEMSLEQIAAAQAKVVRRNRLTDRVFGGVAAGVDLREEVITTSTGAVTVRCYTPTGRVAQATVVNYHGGGWVLGGLDGNDWTCSTVAARVGVQVVSVDYRLAPDHRFPAAVHDCFDAVRWAAELESSAGGLAVMGDSAGGNLAAVTALQCRDAGGPALVHQVLIYPATDLTMQSPSLITNADAPILHRRDVDAFRAHYLGADALDTAPQDPLASPLLAPDLSGLPPALVITAEFDPIRDDGRRYAAALRRAGVAVRHTDYADAPHGFVSIPGLVPVATQALAEICAELSAAFSESAPRDLPGSS